MKSVLFLRLLIEDLRKDFMLKGLQNAMDRGRTEADLLCKVEWYLCSQQD